MAVFNIFDETSRRAAANPLLRALQENRTVELTANCMLVSRDGREYLIEDSAAPIHDKNAELTGAVIVFRDVSRLRASARDMTHLAQHDVLTDLPNRLLLSDRVTNAIALARRYGRQFALLFLDSDGFKAINDTLGHGRGELMVINWPSLRASASASIPEIGAMARRYCAVPIVRCNGSSAVGVTAMPFSPPFE
jgi:predicted signal transduction protein with EAL and GGDEF domain